MLKTIITGALALTTVGTGATAIALNYETPSSTTVNLDYGFDTSVTYSVEEMLNLAIQDEYLAKATYTKLLEAFPEQKLLSNLAQAEQHHIDLLVPLFTTYNLEVPIDPNAGLVVNYATIQEAAKAIVNDELVNVVMYQHFLSQTDLPTDVKDVFGKLLISSTMHMQGAQRIAFDLPKGIGSKRPFNGFANRRINQFRGNPSHTPNPNGYDSSAGESASSNE